MSFTVVTTKRFKREYKKAQKRGKNLSKLQAVVRALVNDGTVPKQNRPHILSGDWTGVWECHIEPDWLLVYEFIDNRVILRRTGTHSDLFKK